MSEQTPVELVRAAYAAFRNNDLDLLLGLMSDDVKWYLPGPTYIIPFAGLREGKHAVREFFLTIAEVEVAEVFEPTTFIASDDKVVAIGHYKWKIISTGKSHESHFAHYFTVRDGRVVAFEEFYDTAAVIEAFTANPSQAAIA